MESLQQVIDQSPDGAILRLKPGVYQGPIRISRPITIWGPPEAVVRTARRGCTIDVRGSGVSILGVRVDGSGNRPDQKDAAVVVRGEDVRVCGVRITNALFGVVAERSRDVKIIDNEVIGDADVPIGLRGDGIQLWETRDSEIRGNRLVHSRDILLQYSPGNKVLDNVCEFGRYGTHFMYSSDALVQGNRYRGNTVGVFVMYSKGIQLRENLLADSTEFGGMAVGLKESSDVQIESNQLIRNHIGVYFDNSPFDLKSKVVVRNNTIALCESGVSFLSSGHRCEFHENRFLANQRQVHVEGTGDARDVVWSRNSFDDYQGYDLDGDGVGDVPYELRSYSSQLTGQHPNLAFFRGSATLGILEAAGRLLPILAPRTILVDSQPRLKTLNP